MYIIIKDYSCLSIKKEYMKMPHICLLRIHYIYIYFFHLLIIHYFLSMFLTMSNWNKCTNFDSPFSLHFKKNMEKRENKLSSVFVLRCIGGNFSVGLCVQAGLVWIIFEYLNKLTLEATSQPFSWAAFWFALHPVCKANFWAVIYTTQSQAKF